MKKSLIIFFCLLAILKTQAQDYLINFTGSGASTNVDSVQVKNLTQGTGLTLNGTDVLHLMGVVGINSVSNSNNNMLHIYPNPSSETSFIEFDVTSKGIVYIELRDITGKQLLRNENMLPLGRHNFALSGLGSGVYTLSIKSAAYSYSGKIVRSSIQPGNPKISYISGNLISTGQTMLKSIQSMVSMQYNDGDQLLFKCFSGIFSTVIPLVPTQSQTVEANFVECTDADGNYYATVTIGTQTWMAENLNVGTRINGSQEQTDNGIIEKYCYNDSTGYCNIYGGLYQWKEIMKYSSTPGVQGICPTGWHIPTSPESCAMTKFLDPTVSCNPAWSGTDAGGKMKSTGTIEAGTGLWLSPNTGATNKSGFTAFPAGCLAYNKQFVDIGYCVYLWTSSELDTNNAWGRLLIWIYSDVAFYDYGKSLGVSVRCMKDS